MIVQTFEFICDRCDKRHREQVELPLGFYPSMASPPSIASLPGGWRYVGPHLLCPLHQVVIDPRPESV